MRKFVAVLLVVTVLGGISGCAGLNLSGSGISAEQAAAGAKYLDESVTTLQAALDSAKAAGDPDKVATAEAVLTETKAAVAKFKSSTSESTWSFARSLITTAVSVAAPIAMRSLVSGS